jgi:hypothetical protein
MRPDHGGHAAETDAHEESHQHDPAATRVISAHRDHDGRFWTFAETKRGSADTDRSCRNTQREDPHRTRSAVRSPPTRLSHREYVRAL